MFYDLLFSFFLIFFVKANEAYLNSSLQTLISLKKSYCSSTSSKKGGDVLNSLGDVAESLVLTNNLTAIVIGANKGAKTGDIRTTDPAFFTVMNNTNFKSWKKIFVEPIPSIYKELLANVNMYHDSKAIVVNAAIVDQTYINKYITMYCWKLDKNGNINYEGFKSLGLRVHGWMAGTCSLNKDRLFHSTDFHFTKSFPMEKVDELIDIFEVKATTVENLFYEYTGILDTIAYLQVDTEGYDAVIIRGLPWYRIDFRPILVNYEYTLLSVTDKRFVHKLLNKMGYMKVHVDSGNEMWALKCKISKFERQADMI